MKKRREQREREERERHAEPRLSRIAATPDATRRPSGYASTASRRSSRRRSAAVSIPPPAAQTSAASATPSIACRQMSRNTSLVNGEATVDADRIDVRDQAVAAAFGELVPDQSRRKQVPDLERDDARPLLADLAREILFGRHPYDPPPRGELESSMSSEVVLCAGHRARVRSQEISGPRCEHLLAGSCPFVNDRGHTFNRIDPRKRPARASDE